MNRRVRVAGNLAFGVGKSDSSCQIPATPAQPKGEIMRNDYNSPDVFTMSTIDRFVLGSKPFTWFQFDTILGIYFWYFPFLDDLDEGEE